MELVRDEAKMKEFEDRARELVAQMTLEEKADFCSGSDF